MHSFILLTGLRIITHSLMDSLHAFYYSTDWTAVYHSLAFFYSIDWVD